MVRKRSIFTSRPITAHMVANVCVSGVNPWSLWITSSCNEPGISNRSRDISHEVSSLSGPGWLQLTFEHRLIRILAVLLIASGIVGDRTWLAIIGAGHISQYLTTVAGAAGYDCTVIDPRTLYASPERFPGATISHEWPDEALGSLGLDSGCAVVALTPQVSWTRRTRAR